jgi:hypothetical protein
MTCERVTLPDGTRAIVCGSRRVRRCACGQPHTLLCDWKVKDRRSGTCDAPLCPRCTTSPMPGKDLCPTHAQAFAARQARQARQGSQS